VIQTFVNSKILPQKYFLFPSSFSPMFGEIAIR